MAFYRGNEPGQVPGMPPDPYFWWQGGALWGTMIDYWRYTLDAQYNDLTQQSLLFQVGPNQDYLPPNITVSIGNDDQSFWAMSTMLAAEVGFQDPVESQPQWLSLALAVYNTQKGLLDIETACGGGLRWQVIAMNNGYTYKNTITNAIFFNVAARLGRYTGKTTYLDTAKSQFQWLRRVNFIDDEYNVWDGAHTEHDCTDINHKQTSYLPAVLMQGAAFMWDSTEDDFWKTQVDSLLSAMLADFSLDNVLYEPACDSQSHPSATECTPDMRFYKGFALRWMTDTVALCSWTKDIIGSVVMASAKAAVATCTGGASGRACGRNWHNGEHDGDVGVGQEMDVLAALMTAMLFWEKPNRGQTRPQGRPQDGPQDGPQDMPVGSGDDTVLDDNGHTATDDGTAGTGDGAPVNGFYGESGDQPNSFIPPQTDDSSEPEGHRFTPPLTHDSGGTSVGDEHAGKERRKHKPIFLAPIDKTDTAGASLLTVLLLASFFAFTAWICFDHTDAQMKAGVDGDIEMQVLESIGNHVAASVGSRPRPRQRGSEGNRGRSGRPRDVAPGATGWCARSIAKCAQAGQA